jgi:hypothetical protein
VSASIPEKYSIFISFRNGDEGFAPELVKTALTQKFDPEQIFLSRDSIPPGADFPHALRDRAANCRVLLALIGSRWLTMTDSSGRRKLEQRNDWVRIEIAAALSAKRTVIPIMLNGASRLNEADLPADIKGLARLQELRVDRYNVPGSTQRLKDRLMELIPALASAETRPAVLQADISTGKVEKSGKVHGVNQETPAGERPDSASVNLRIKGSVAGEVVGVTSRRIPRDQDTAPGAG